MNHGTMYSINLVHSEAFNSSIQGAIPHKPTLTSREFSEMQDWLARLPITDEGIRAQIAHSLQTLQHTYQPA